jgi:hypothetical protein
MMLKAGADPKIYLEVAGERYLSCAVDSAQNQRETGAGAS